MRSSKIGPPAAISSKRRKSSINVLVDAVLQSSIDSPQHLSTQVSTVKDYRRFRTPKERVIAAASTYQREILVNYGHWESKLEFSKNTVKDFMMTQKEAGLPGANRFVLRHIPNISFYGWRMTAAVDLGNLP